MLRVGEVFAGYRVIRKLGSGGMGSVYLVKHPRLPRYDALKVLNQGPSADREFRARFLREAELAGRLSHPNVVATHDRGVFEGALWIAMQYVEGCDAADLAASGPSALPPERALHIITEAARGLDTAHGAGLLHRDVKPANILVSPKSGAADRVLVTDFGIARATAESTALTADGEVLATVAYAAPEQISGEPLDHRADVYALGGTLYHLLTGSKPFPRPTPAAIMFAHLTDPPPRPSLLVPGLPAQLDGVIARAMAKNPGERYPTCGALAAAAAAALRGQDQPAEPIPPARRRLRIIMAAAVLVLAVAVAVGLGIRSTGSPDDSPVAATGTSTTSAPTTTMDFSAQWGPVGYIVSAFPDLLPHTALGTGYRGLRCLRSQVNATVMPSSVAPDFDAMSCTGDGNPLSSLTLACNSSNLPFPAQALPNITKAGEQQWTRNSGSGRAFWGDGPDADGRTTGVLQISFDNPAQSFCLLTAYSRNGSGQTLYERWWPGAPV
ncbi:serine/threonine-protein kinase [Nocardia crassostreae]|uniref:serine/threonine-protein kinase n=1 Tax=Nocardia crassostreae TaxID=53428 RepID=UPI000B239E48|nr:serine/threonine-protein kinase [Nocardia crassostreae]